MMKKIICLTGLLWLAGLSLASAEERKYIFGQGMQNLLRQQLAVESRPDVAEKLFFLPTQPEEGKGEKSTQAGKTPATPSQPK